MHSQVSGNQLTLEHKTPVEGMPRAMTYFQGRVLVGIRYLACLDCALGLLGEISRGETKRSGQGETRASEDNWMEDGGRRASQGVPDTDLTPKIVQSGTRGLSAHV